MTSLSFEKDMIGRENKRLNAELKPGEHFCPCCGTATKEEICDRYRTVRKSLTVKRGNV